jgi:hypothetical protein
LQLSALTDCQDSILAYKSALSYLKTVRHGIKKFYILFTKRLCCHDFSGLLGSHVLQQTTCGFYQSCLTDAIQNWRVRIVYVRLKNETVSGFVKYSFFHFNNE